MTINQTFEESMSRGTLSVLTPLSPETKQNSPKEFPKFRRYLFENIKRQNPVNLDSKD